MGALQNSNQSFEEMAAEQEQAEAKAEAIAETTEANAAVVDATQPASVIDAQISE